MKVEKMVSVVLTEDEVKDAIMLWMKQRQPWHAGLSNHLKDNECCIEFVGDELVISVDGIYESENA